jgi:hypothetical protein
MIVVLHNSVKRAFAKFVKKEPAAKRAGHQEMVKSVKWGDGKPFVKDIVVLMQLKTVVVDRIVLVKFVVRCTSVLKVYSPNTVLNVAWMRTVVSTKIVPTDNVFLSLLSRRVV